MKWTIIGYWGAYPAVEEAASGYLVQTDEHNLLIDCGSGVLSKLQNRMALEHLDAVILSHYHTDHMADIYSLQYATMILTQLGKRNKPLQIYGLETNDGTLSSLSYGEYCLGKEISPSSVLTFGDVRIRFAKTVHPKPCLAMRLESNTKTLVYSADTAWSKEVLQLAQNADVFVCESSLYERQRGQIPGHLTGKEAGEMAVKANVKALCLTHLPHYGDHRQLVEEAREVFFGQVCLASYGKSWVLS